VTVRDPFDTRWPGVETGGRLALDFTNTLDWRLRRSPVELLGSYRDLMRWAWSAGVLEKSEARALTAWAEGRPRAATRVLAEAIEIREAIASAFQSIARGERPPPPALARLEAAFLRASAARTLRAGDAGATWVWRANTPEPERAAWAAVLDAVGLLGSPELGRVRQCADAECGWMFLDTSRNRSRRWCSMEACGNRNKVRGFYRRARAGGRTPRRRPGDPS